MLSASTTARVRTSNRQDGPALAGVYGRSWRQAYSGIIPHRQLDAMIRRRDADWWSGAASGGRLLALDVSGTLAGYASCGPARSKQLGAGEIYELYLDPVYQGIGLGEQLFEGCRAYLDRRRLDGLVVWVLADNDVAMRFYWGRGGRPAARMMERLGSTRLEKIGLAWP
jgi:ribosomal protein S18 acetylase RimI-like enzyme